MFMLVNQDMRPKNNCIAIVRPNKTQKNKMDLGMACHTPPLKKAKKQGEMPLPSLGPIPSLNLTV